MRIAVFLHNELPCFRLEEAQAERLRAALPEADIVHCRDAESFAGALRGAEIAVAWRCEQAWVDQAENLKWLATPAAGREYFNAHPLPGVEVMHGAFHGEIMGETVLAMMLAHNRGILTTHRLRGTDLWPRSALAGEMKTLAGEHAVILGFGNIGRWIGRFAKRFGMRITGIKRTPARLPEYFDVHDRIVLMDRFTEALGEADHLILALPSDTGTDRLVGAGELACLPSRAAVYNVGRGNAIDETALAQALGEKRIAGAYLDVFATEPLSADSPLRECENVLLMPHASAFAPNYLDLFLKEFVQRYREKFG